MSGRRLRFVIVAIASSAGAVACSSGGAAPLGDGGVAADGASSADALAPDVVSSSEGGSTPGDAAASDGASVVDAGTDVATSCLTKSVVIAVVQTATGECSFTFSQPYTDGQINMLLSPGWGRVCHAGSSSNCGSGASADGWWFSAANEISVCDSTCTRFYNQTIAGKLTMELGCATEACSH